jgi:hypothetical protein
MVNAGNVIEATNTLNSVSKKLWNDKDVIMMTNWRAKETLWIKNQREKTETMLKNKEKLIHRLMPKNRVYHTLDVSTIAVSKAAIETEIDDNGIEVVICFHDNIVEITEIDNDIDSEHAIPCFECLDCGRKFVTKREGIRVYQDIVAIDDEMEPINEVEDVLEDTHEIHGIGLTHRYSDPDFYDTYDGLLPKVSKDHMSHEIGDVKDCHAVDMDNNRIDSDGNPIDNQFSKEKTEITEVKLLSFWGTGDRCNSFVHDILHHSKKDGSHPFLDKKFAEIKHLLTNSEVSWVEELMTVEPLSEMTKAIMPQKKVIVEYVKNRKAAIWGPNKAWFTYDYKSVWIGYDRWVDYRRKCVLEAHKELDIKGAKEVLLLEYKPSPKDTRYTKIKVMKYPSYKYGGKEYRKIVCLVDNKHSVWLENVQGCSNWVSSHKNMSVDTMNEIIAAAGL